MLKQALLLLCATCIMATALVQMIQNKMLRIALDDCQGVVESAVRTRYGAVSPAYSCRRIKREMAGQ